MGPLALLGLIGQFAPLITKHVSNSSDVNKVAEIAGSIATKIAGVSDPAEAATAIQLSPELQAKFNSELIEQQNKFEELYFRDKADARARDTAIISSGKKNYRADIMFVLAVVVVGYLTYIVWKDPTINEYVKGIVTLVLGRFLGYLDNIYNYEFGTTRINQMKDATINNLTSKG